MRLSSIQDELLSGIGTVSTCQLNWQHYPLGFMQYSARLILILSLIGIGSFSHAAKTLEQEALEWFLLSAGLNAGQQLFLNWYAQEPEQGLIETNDDDEDSSSEEPINELSMLLEERLLERRAQDEAFAAHFREGTQGVLPPPIVVTPFTAEEFEARLTAYENGEDLEFANVLYGYDVDFFRHNDDPSPYDPMETTQMPLVPEDFLPDINNDGIDREFWEGTVQKVPVSLYQDGGKQHTTRIDRLSFPSHNNHNTALLPLGSFLWEVDVPEDEDDETSLMSDPHARLPVKGKIFKSGDKIQHSIFSAGKEHHQTSALKGPGPLSGSRKTVNAFPQGLSSDGYRYVDPTTKSITSFDRGHGIDFNDGTLDSTHALDNYTPQNFYYNRSVRGPLVKNIIKKGHFYIEIAIYAAEPKITQDGTPIPEGFLFIHKNAAGKIVNVYYFPNHWNYRDQIKANKRNDKSAYACVLRICKIEDPMVEAFVYRSALANEEINAHINAAFRRAQELLTGGSIPDQTLRVAIALQLMGEAATLESNRIDGGARLLSLLTGFANNEHVQQNPSRALGLFAMLIHRAFYHFHGLTSGYRTWTPADDIQAQNQMVALYQLLMFVGLREQAAIIQKIVKEADDNREFGIMINCWSSGKDPNNLLEAVPDYTPITEKELLAAFYNNCVARSPKERVFNGIFENTPVRFAEHRIRKDGNCGFTGLGVERGDAIIQLMTHAGNDHVRALLAPDIRAAILAGDWDNALEAEAPRNLYELGMPEALNQYVQRIDVFERFLLHYKNSTTWLSYVRNETGMLDAIAYINNINVNIWGENEAGNLELIHRTHPVANERNTIHLLHTDGLTHFNLLSIENTDAITKGSEED